MARKAKFNTLNRIRKRLVDSSGNAAVWGNTLRTLVKCCSVMRLASEPTSVPAPPMFTPMGRQHRRVIAAQKLVGAVGLEEHLVDDALHHGTAGTMPQHYLLVCHYINLPVVVSTSLPFFTPLVPKMRFATLCTRPVSPRMTMTSRHMCSSTCTCIVEIIVSK